MQRTRREALLTATLLSLLPQAVPAQPQGTTTRAEVEILVARTDGRRHSLLIETRSGTDALRIIAVYRRNGWQAAMAPSSPSQLERILALGKRLTDSPQRDISPHNVKVARWALEFEEDRLPTDLFAIACRISDVHGGRSLERELPDIRRILEQVNAPNYSQRDKSVEDVLRALFEFDWQPLGYTQLSATARRN